MVKIMYNKKKCTECGLCASLRPDVFVLNEDGIEVIKNTENQTSKKIDEKLIEDLKMIEMSCPGKAIEIVEQVPRRRVKRREPK